MPHTAYVQDAACASVVFEEMVVERALEAEREHAIWADYDVAAAAHTVTTEIEHAIWDHPPKIWTGGEGRAIYFNTNIKGTMKSLHSAYR